MSLDQHVRPAVASTADACAAQLRTHGFALLRGALDRQAVNRIRSAVASFFRRFEDEAAAGRRSQRQVELYRRYGNLTLSTILEDGFAGAEEVLSAVDRSIIADALREYFVDSVSILRHHVLARQYRARNSYGNVVPFHQDINAVDPRASVTSWIPLVRCGRRAPGLEVVGQRLGAVLPTDPHSSYQCGLEIAEREIVGRYPLIHPEFLPGDALLFLNTTPHRSYVAPGMTETRLSFELRYIPQHALAATDDPTDLFALRAA